MTFAMDSPPAIYTGVRTPYRAAKLLQSDVDWLRNAWLSCSPDVTKIAFSRQYQILLRQERQVSVSGFHIREIISNMVWASHQYKRLLLRRGDPDRLTFEVTTQIRARYERLRHDYSSKSAFAVDAQAWLRTAFGLDIPLASIRVALSRQQHTQPCGPQLIALLADGRPRTEGQIRTHFGWSQTQWNSARQWLGRQQIRLARHPLPLANDSGYAWEYSLADQERGH